MQFLDGRLPDRFWDKVVPEPNSGCWLWTASLNSAGYGQIYSGKRSPPAFAHRLAYERLIGTIRGGLDLDHLCRTRCCVNPLHLEPVTRRENLLRGNTIPSALASRTHCDRGHEFTPENTKLVKGYRSCRKCNKERRRERWSAQTDEQRTRYNAKKREAYRAAKEMP